MTKLRAIKVTFMPWGVEYALTYAHGGEPSESTLSSSTGGEGGC